MIHPTPPHISHSASRISHFENLIYISSHDPPSLYHSSKYLLSTVYRLPYSYTALHLPDSDGRINTNNARGAHPHPHPRPISPIPSPPLLSFTSPPANPGNSLPWTTLPKRAPTTCLRVKSCRLHYQRQHRQQQHQRQQQRHPRRLESRGPSATAAIANTSVGNTMLETRAATVYVLDIFVSSPRSHAPTHAQYDAATKLS